MVTMVATIYIVLEHVTVDKNLSANSVASRQLSFRVNHVTFTVYKYLPL